MRKIIEVMMFSALCLFALTLCAAPLIGGSDDGKTPEKAASAKKAFVTSLTIFPVRMMERSFQNVAEVLGVILEKEGFRKLAIAETPFVPKAGVSFKDTADAFGLFVVKQGMKTDYALFGEFIGSGKEGVKGVRGVVVDRKGKVVWTVDQKPGDKEFKRDKPACPMTCCVFLAARLQPELIMAKPGEAVGEGPMERLWEKKSGTPGKKEYAAIEKRLVEMKKKTGEKTLLVYPVRTGKKVDRKGAEQLAQILGERNLIKTRVAGTQPWFDIKPNSNEQRVLWDMARAVQAHVRKNPPATDYVLYADYLLHRGEGKVAGAVHFVVCDRKGDWVIVDFQNNHHDDFNKIEPRTCTDCGRLAALRFEGCLK